LIARSRKAKRKICKGSVNNAAFTPIKIFKPAIALTVPAMSRGRRTMFNAPRINVAASRPLHLSL